MQIGQTLAMATQRLTAVSDSPRFDAELLLAFALQRESTYLHTWPERCLEEDQVAVFEALVARREESEPIAYLLGWSGFWDFECSVSPETLIPRPETELLVEAALERIPCDVSWRIADLGTGSGAIALAIARERPNCRLVATDRSEGALRVASTNAERLPNTHCEFRTGNWFEPLHGEQFEIIVSNPPYIALGDEHLWYGDVRHEPREALVSGEEGLADLRHIIANASDFLVRGGWLLLEHGYNQGAFVTDILRRHGYGEVVDLPDLQGHDRIALGRYS